MRWRRAFAGIAGVVGAGALTVYAFHLRAARLPPRAPETHAGATAGPVFFDVACAIPEDWAGLPVIAHADATHTKQVTVDEGLMSDVRMATAPLGDVFVQYRWDQCIGGSACAGNPRSLRDLRVGPLDEWGAPRIRVDFSCAGTSPFDPPSPTKRSCDPSTLALRRSTDEHTFVLTVRDPDAVEKAIAAFSRNPKAR